MKFESTQKTFILLCSILLLSFTTVTDDPKDRLNVKGPLNFGDKSFKIAWTSHPQENYYIQEYLPDGEKLDGFNQMLTIYLHVSDSAVNDAVTQKIEELTKRKKTDAVCNYIVNESPDGKEFILDFLVGESKDNKMTVVEFNIYRYKKIDLKNGKKATIIYAYSKRAYRNEITPFLKSLGESRTGYLNDMIASEIPLVKIGKD